MAGGLLSRKALMLAKTETTEGEDAVPASTTDALLVSAPTITLNGEQLTRDIIKASLSPLGWIVGAVTLTATFSTEIRGIGAVPDDTTNQLRDDPLFRMTGLYPDYTAPTMPFYGFDSTPAANTTTATIYAYLDGVVIKMTSCRGNLEIVMPAGGYGKYNWTAQGVMATLGTGTGGITDQDVPTDAVFQAPTVKPARFQGTGSFSTHTFSACIEQLTLNLNNEIQERRCANADNGVEGYVLTNRNPGGTMNPEMTKRVDHDWWLKWQESTNGALSAVIDNGGTGGEITVAAPAIQYGTPAFGDRNGIRVLDVPFVCNLSAADDDELTITYKTGT